MKNQISKYVYLISFIIILIIVGFGIIILNPSVISIILSLGYLSFFMLTKTTSYFDKELFIIRYEVAFFLTITLVVGIIQATINDAVRSLPLILMAILFLLIAYLIFSWVYEKIKLIKELKNEKLHSELSLLRAQINPHFFFNTLNNLYGLAIEKSEETPKVLLKLSEMMRYTIYDGKKELVRLADEIDFLKNYVHLHTIRHFDKLDIKFNIQIGTKNLQLPPLLLINLIENAFKHGAEKLDKGAYININISTNEKILNFVVENNFDENNHQIEGMGIKNLKRRLSLLYPENHELSINIHSNVYRAELSLNLSK